MFGGNGNFKAAFESTKQRIKAKYRGFVKDVLIWEHISAAGKLSSECQPNRV